MIPQEFRIPPHKKLIILDAHDTIFKRDLSRQADAPLEAAEDKDKVAWVLREGFLNFIDYFHGVLGLRIVISSDGGKQKLTEISRRFGIFKSLEKIYGSDHMDPDTYLKRLDLILQEMGVAAAEALFIGDGPIDGKSCEHYGVDWIQVPNTIEGREFSFNRFLHLDFTAQNHGLELQKIVNLKEVHYNLSTPELIEHCVAKGEGSLAHLGPLAVSFPAATEARLVQYIVKEPSCEAEIDWAGEFQPFAMENFEQLYLRLLAFLQDREIYIQDCRTGAGPKSEVPLRILTQNAWHSLFVRNMFLQLSTQAQRDFFPEYTLMCLPGFQAIPEYDLVASKSFVVINLLKKLVIIGGDWNPNRMREAIFAVLSVILPADDVIPLRCTSNLNAAGELNLHFNDATRLAALSPDLRYFGDDAHGWGRDAFFNMEWGVLMPLKGLSKEQNPILNKAARNFGTLLLQCQLDEHRRIDWDSPLVQAGAMAGFPITHLAGAERSGQAAPPLRLFCYLHDPKLRFPLLSLLSAEEAALHLLLGFQQGPQGTEFLPFFGNRPFTLAPAKYAGLLYERILRAKTQCYLVNQAAGTAAEVRSQMEHLQLPGAEPPPGQPLNCLLCSPLGPACQPQPAQVELGRQLVAHLQGYAENLPYELRKRLRSAAEGNSSFTS